MQQYFFKQRVSIGEVISLSADDSYHLIKVLRANPGMDLRLIAKGVPYLATITKLTNKLVDVQIVKKINEIAELDKNITIALGLLKQDKFEYAVQKMTELGVHSIVPWQAERSISRIDAKKVEKKVSRWQTIAKEASEQSRRHIIPHINFPCTTSQISQLFSEYDKILLAYEDMAHSPAELAGALNDFDGKKILIIIGPEGGISHRELAEFKKYNVESISLGHRILRAETAAIFCMSICSSIFN